MKKQDVSVLYLLILDHLKLVWKFSNKILTHQSDPYCGQTPWLFNHLSGINKTNDQILSQTRRFVHINQKLLNHSSLPEKYKIRPFCRN